MSEQEARCEVCQHYWPAATLSQRGPHCELGRELKPCGEYKFNPDAEDADGN